MNIVALTFRDYLKASAFTEESDMIQFYKDLFGKDWATLISYHLKVKEPEDLSLKFNISLDIDEIVFGQFVGIEKALTSRLKEEDSIMHLAFSLLRPLGDKEFDNTDLEKEQLNMDNILNSDARGVLNILNEFSKIRDKYIKEDYNGVFYISSSDDDEVEEELPEDVEEDAEITFSRQWYWYAIARSLAESGIVYPEQSGMSKIEAVYMTKMGIIAPELAYQRQKDIIEELRQKKQNILNK